MAATLPPIQGASAGGGMSSGMTGSMKHSQPVHFAPAPPKGPPSGRLKPIKQLKIQERDYAATKGYPTQPMLTKRQTTAYRNTYKHNLCVEMLHTGFHKSFCELFALIKQQEDERKQAGPESLMWSMNLLRDQHEKLDKLRTFLTRAESAMRIGDYDEVYRCRYELARYFQSTEDKWLSDHFFDTCLQTSQEFSNDNGKMMAEALCNVALAQEDNGEYYDALEHFEAYHGLASNNKDWMTADGITYHTDSCIHLSRIYTTVGNRLEGEDLSQTLDLLTKAYNMAKEARQKRLEGEAAYKLGLACEKSGDGETALLHLNSYLGLCRASDDSDGIGKACDAIAKAFARMLMSLDLYKVYQALLDCLVIKTELVQKEGKIEESIEYLKQFVEVAEKSGQEQAYSRACHNLGNIYNTLGKYEEATKYFDKAYNLSRSMGDTEAINMNRVQFGIAQAHTMMGGLGKHIVVNQRSTLERLIEWKSARTDEFDKDIPEPEKPATPQEPAKEEAPAPKTPAKSSTEEEETEEKKDEEKKEETAPSSAPSETAESG